MTNFCNTQIFVQSKLIVPYRNIKSNQLPRSKSRFMAMMELKSICYVRKK